MKIGRSIILLAFVFVGFQTPYLQAQSLKDLSDDELREHQTKLEDYISSLERLMEQVKRAEQVQFGNGFPEGFSLEDWKLRYDANQRKSLPLFEKIRKKEAWVENSKKALFYEALDEVLISLDLIGKELDPLRSLEEIDASYPRALLEISVNQLTFLFTEHLSFISDPEDQETAFLWLLELESLRKELNADIGFFKDPIETPLIDRHLQDLDNQMRGLHTNVLFILGSYAGLELLRRAWKMRAVLEFRKRSLERLEKKKGCASLIKKWSEHGPKIRRGLKWGIPAGLAVFGGYLGLRASSDRFEQEDILYEMDPEKRLFMEIKIFHKYQRRNLMQILNAYSSYQNAFRQTWASELFEFRMSGAREYEAKLLDRWPSLEEARELHKNQLVRIQLELESR